MPSENINLISPSGDLVDGPQEWADWAVENGYRNPNESEIAALKAYETEQQQREFIKEEMSGPVGTALTTGFSAANTALLGGPKALVKQLAPESAEYLDIAEEANPTAKTVGDVAGIGASLVYGGPMFEGIAGAGKLAGGAVERGVGAVAGQTAGKVAGTVARYATEGMVTTLPQAAPEAILGDPEDAAELIMTGGIIGGGIGTALHAGGNFASMLLKGAGKVVEEVAPKLPSLQKVAGDIEQNQFDKFLNITRAAKDKLEKNGIKTEDILDFDKRYGVTRLTSNAESSGATVEAVRKEVGSKIGAITQTLDDSGQPFVNSKQLAAGFEKAKDSIRPGKVFDTQRKWIDDTLDGVKHLYQDDTGALKQVSASDLAYMKDYFKSAEELFPVLQAGKSTAKNKATSALYDVTQKALDNAVKAAEESGLPIAFKEYKALQRDYSIAKSYIPIAKKAQSFGNNQTIGLTDSYAGIGGAVLGGAPGAVAGVAVSSLRDRYGPQAAMLLARKTKEALERRNSMIDGAVDSFLSGEKVAERTTASTKLRDISKYLTGAEANGQQALVDITDRLAQLASNPTALINTLHPIVGPVNSDLPMLGTAMTSQAGKTIQYLQQEAPRRPSTPSPFESQDFQISDTEMNSFERKLRAALDPYTVLDDMKQGSLDVDSVKTIKYLYPKFYSQLSTAIIAKAGEKPRKYSFQQRQRLAVLFDGNVDKLFAPESLNILQTQYATKESNQTPDQMAQSGKTINLPEAQQTTLQRVQAR